jgi:hypothetical protein
LKIRKKCDKIAQRDIAKKGLDLDGGIYEREKCSKE